MAKATSKAKTKEIQKANAQMIEIEDLAPQTIKIGEQMIMAMPKHFQNGQGSKGYHASGKMVVEGRNCQINVIISIIGTKPQSDSK